MEKLSNEALRAFRREADDRYKAFVARGVCLDLSRGNPAPEQLDLSRELLNAASDGDYLTSDGIDCRGYNGGVLGISEARHLFAPLLGATPDQVMASGNSSLALMHDALTFAYLHGVPGGSGAWHKAEQQTAFLCPAPGYDRHFRICETLGIRMIPVPMQADGPDMDVVEELAADPTVRGMWSVPQYSNPTGVTYSEEVVRRIAAMQTGAPDFRVFWDNAYAVHDLNETEQERVASLIEACMQAGHADRPFVFASTSKITLPGAGVAFFASSEANLSWFCHHVNRRTIGPNKINQLRHVRFLGDLDGINAHMSRHRALLKPKFDAVLSTLDEHLGGKDVARWTNPRGGYFINIDLHGGGARRVASLALDAGIRLTPAGATFPYGDDPADQNLRIGPSGGTVEALRTAAEGLSLSILLAAADGHLARRASALVA
ncbi:aminotransferase class I/II-fold pyridoxal phosphate-dependent enzyme [Sphingomonadaceae bacterium jetA1]|jgi:aspartate/methionine/tyrosine aminotransferase|uniref:aminotransferase class I/II-fold pyridoxal phosphate-dependent enzyme n=1 Tax=Facivitalis istanbulensis TaxID=3075838 RepID=UPI00349146FC